MIEKMKNKMKINGFIAAFCLLLFGFLTGCDNYERKSLVTPNITVNVPLLSLYVGQTAELKASPVDLTYQWMSEDPQVASVDNKGVVTAVGNGNTFIVASSGDMKCRVPVSSITRIPLKDINLGATNILMFTKERSQFIPVMVPSNANDAGYVYWRTLNYNIATVDYKGEIVAVNVGSTDVECQVNNIVKTIHVDVMDSYPMFRGPHKLRASTPYTLQFINFDFGGPEVAYHDNDTGNNGGNNYRANNGDPLGGQVDIGGDLAIGWTGAGEWLKYTVICYDPGEYMLSMDLAGDGESEILFEIDGVQAIDNIIVPRTGGWSNWIWQNVDQPIKFKEGKQTIRFYLVRAGTNFRNMRFTYKK